MTSLVLGVDPGLSGAFVLLEIRPGGNFVIRDAAAIPVRTESLKSGTIRKHVDERECVRAFEYFYAASARRCAIEKVGGITGQSASAAFNFGAGWGSLVASAYAAGFEIDFVSPLGWRAALNMTVKATRQNVKSGSIDRANAILGFNAFDKTPEGSAKADAALIAMASTLIRQKEQASMVAKAFAPARKAVKNVARKVVVK